MKLRITHIDTLHIHLTAPVVLENKNIGNIHITLTYIGIQIFSW